MKTQAQIELDETRHALNNPKLKLFETTKLQWRLGELLRQVEKEKDNTDEQPETASPAA